MRLTVRVFVLAAAVGLVGLAAARADDGAVDRQLDSLEVQIRELRADLSTEARLAGVTAQDAGAAISEATGTDHKAVFEKGILSGGDEWIKIGGSLQIKARDVETDRTELRLDQRSVVGADNGWGEFTLDSTTIDVTAYYTPDVLGYICFATDDSGLGVGVVQAYLEWNALLDTFAVEDPTNTYLRLGLMPPFDQPAWPLEGATETWPLVQNAFQRDEVAGVELGGASEPIELDGVTLTPRYRFAVVNGRFIGERSANDDEFGATAGPFPMLMERAFNGDLNDNKQVGAGGGLTADMGEIGTLDLFAYGWAGKLTNGDRTWLRDPAGAHPWFWYQHGGDFAAGAVSQDMWNYTTDDDYCRGGLQATYSLPVEGVGEFGWFLQAAWAEYGKLNRGGFENLVEFRVDLPGIEHDGRSWFTAVTPYYVFSNLQEHGIFSYPTDARTWDRKANQFGLYVDVTKNIKLKCEWGLFEEHIGSLVTNTGIAMDPTVVGSSTFSPDNCHRSDPENDEFVLQLEVAF